MQLLPPAHYEEEELDMTRAAERAMEEIFAGISRGCLKSLRKTIRVQFLPSYKGRNGRALDRVTKQKHRPNRQKLSKKRPKIVFPENFSTFSDMLSTFPFSGLSNDFARYNIRGITP